MTPPRDDIGFIVGAWIIALIAIVAFAFWFTARAQAHDSWISRGGHKNGAGEWCCGEGDCFVIPGPSVAATPAGYALFGGAEIVPYGEAQPSPDGAYWRCERPDGSRRCFFAPPPGS